MTEVGIRTLVECEIEIVGICIGPGGPGHFRSEEGSEHFFFYNVERLTGRGFVHGWIVGLGIFLMTRLQENRAAWIAGLMDRLGLPYQPREMRMTREDGRWWSVIDEREIGTPFVTAAIEDLRMAYPVLKR